MDMTRIEPKDRQHIQKYGPGGFTVSLVRFDGPVLVFAKESLPWDCADIGQISADSFRPIVERAASLDLCLLGCGPRMVPVPKDVKGTLKDVGVNIEPMDSGAACRTFNVLLAEGRAVCAALFPS